MDFFGLDIGTVNTKVMRTSGGSSNHRLEAAGMIATPTGGMLSESEASVAKMAEAINQVRSAAKISTKNVVVSLPESEVFTRIVTLPKMSMSELESAISWEAEQYIPLPMQDVNYSYSVVDIRSDGSIDVMIVAAPKRLVEKYEKVLQIAGLTVIAIETELLATARSVTDEKSRDYVLVVDCGARTTDMAVVKASNVVFTRSISTAGEALTRAIMTNLQMDESQAEAFKRSYGMMPNQLEGKVMVAMQQVMQVIASEIHRTVTFFESHANGNRVKQVVVVGGTSLMPDFVTNLAGLLNLEVLLGNPGQLLANQDKVGKLEGLPMYTVCAGLAVKDF